MYNVYVEKKSLLLYYNGRIHEKVRNQTWLHYQFCLRLVQPLLF